MNRIQTLLGSTIVAGALVATPVVLALSAGQSDAQPSKATVTTTLTDDKGGNGGKGKHTEPGDDRGRHGTVLQLTAVSDDKSVKITDDKGGNVKHSEPGDDHGRDGAKATPAASTDDKSVKGTDDKGGKHHEPGDDHGRHGSDDRR